MVNLIICARVPVTWSAVERYSQPIQYYCHNDENYDNNTDNDNDDNNNNNDYDSNDDNNNNHGGGGVRDGDGDDGDVDGDGNNDGDNNNDNRDLWYANLSSPGLLKAWNRSVYILIYIAVTYHYVNQPLNKSVLSFILKLSTVLAPFAKRFEGGHYSVASAGVICLKLWSLRINRAA